MCIDFRKNQRCPKSDHIKGEAVERVETYKYLVVVFDSKLNWKGDIHSVLKKVNLRMYCLRKLRSFGVNSDMVVTFYNAVTCSIIVFGSVCQGGNVSKFNRGRLEKIVEKAGHVVGMPLDSFKTLYEKLLLKKLMEILNDPRCSNQSGRFLLPETKTNRYKALFLPSALSVNKYYNSH